MRKTWAVLLLATSAFAEPIHAPLPAEAYTAKSIAIVNHTGTQKVLDKAYEGLMKWGRFKVVQNADDADMVLVIDVDRESRGATASTYGNNTTVTEVRATYLITSFILKGRKEPFFTEQERAALLRKSATQRGIDELKKRLDEGPPKP